MLSLLRAALFLLPILLLPVEGATAGKLVDESDRRLLNRIETGLRPLSHKVGERPETFLLSDRMAHWRVPGVSIAIIEDGEIVFVKGFGTKGGDAGSPVTEDTVFSAGSISKMGNAALILRLHAAGVVDIDAPVTEHLKIWTPGEAAYASAADVNLRALLSHTAGFGVHGFPDFVPDEELPDILETLSGTGPVKTEPVQFIYRPTKFASYSGGGTMVSQLVMTDATAQSYPAIAAQYVFDPLKMSRSTYVNPLPGDYEDVALAHDENGRLTASPRGYHSFPEMAASGLWTTAGDIARLYIALFDSYHGASPFLPQALAVDMMTTVAPGRAGLGPFLTGQGEERRFYHAGANASYRAWSEMFFETGNGMVILTNGSNGSKLYYELRRSICDAMNWPCHQSIGEIALKIAVEDPDALAGDYRIADYGEAAPLRARAMAPIERVLVARDDSGVLKVSVPGITAPERLIPIAPMSFVIENTPSSTPYFVTAEFLQDAHGKVDHLTLTIDGADLLFVRQ